MILVQYIRDHTAHFLSCMHRRGLTVRDVDGSVKDINGVSSCSNVDVDIQEILFLDDRRRFHVANLQSIQETKNTVSNIFKQKNNALDDSIKDRVKSESKRLTEKIEEEGRLLSEVEEKLSNILDHIPNILDDRVPFGFNEDNNALLRVVGDKKKISFVPLEHDVLGTNLGMMHFDIAAKIAGSRFNVLSGDLAALFRALKNFMIDVHIKNGFTEVNFPHIVNKKSMRGTGQLPKFDDNFKTSEADDGYYLIPTGEVPMTNLVADQILEKSDMPIRLVGYSECYRREAGSAGKDTKGMLRQHQFGKVELVSICTQDNSDAEHLYILSSVEEVLQKLGLHYRVMVLCSGDIGFSSRLTYDIEVWLPAQNSYREISSCSNNGDFQALRMKTRYRDSVKKIPVHTLNGSGLAVGRTLVAILENYQNSDGSVTIPDVLLPYMANSRNHTTQTEHGNTNQIGNVILPSNGNCFLNRNR